MHEIVDATAQLCRRRGLEVDRAAARLALLTVVDHLDRVLEPTELVALADALPLGLSLMVQRRSGIERTQFELVDETSLRAACEALSCVVSEPLAAVLRDEVADVLLGRRPRAAVDRSGEVRVLARTTSVPPSRRSISERPTLRVECTPETPVALPEGDLSDATTRPPAGRRPRLARAG